MGSSEAIEVPGRLSRRGGLRHRVEDFVDGWIGHRIETVLEGRVRREVECQLAATSGVRTSQTELQHRRELSGDVLLGTGSGHDRTLRRTQLDQLTAQIQALSGRSNLDLPLSQAYRAILECEGRGLGRIAGSTYNILGKLALPPLLQPPAGPILEIGTLYGLYALALVRQFRRVGDFRCLTVIDPLEGTQIQPGHVGGTDPSGTPVTVEVARRNFADGGLRPDEVRLVRGYSTDAGVREQAADQTYAVVVIDGDHSEEGVYRDLWWVQDLVAPAGLVVMDDWGDRHWPGVERAGRRYLADGGRLELLGTAWTSAYLRSPETPADRR